MTRLSFFRFFNIVIPPALHSQVKEGENDNPAKYHALRVER